MKVFWAVFLLLIAGSVAYLTLGGDASRPRQVKSDAPAPVIELPAPPPRAPGQKDNDESAFFPETPAVTPTPAKVETAKTPDAPAPAPSDVPTATETKPVENRIPDPVPAEVAPPPKPVESAPKPEESKPVEAKPVPPPVEQKPAPAAPTPAPTPGDSAVGFGADAKVVKNDDGTLMIDDKYPLKGEGTKEKPYEITWEYLISAQEDYQPRLGKKKLPGRMKLVTGKYVKITGFVAFPIMATEPTEMLAMLNQWDGCCIGIPPTPYDAIEVKLKEPASNEERLTTYGAVEGKLMVEPYLVRDWLVSLYTMDEATMHKAQ